MRLAALVALVFALAAAAPAVAADDPVSGTWLIHGKISAFAFQLTCKFERKGKAIGGVCYDGGTNRPHPLTYGEASGDKVSWTYQSSYLLKKLDAAYSGLLAGTSIKGQISVLGHLGYFSAEKQP